MEKVKLTREQIMVLEHFKQNNFGVEDFVLGREHWNNTYTPLKDIPIDAFARIMYEPDSYEVEEEYKVGDWIVVNWRGTHEKPRTYKVISVSPDGCISIDNHGKGANTGPNMNLVRHATPEEIKAEQERREWAKIGREVREFQKGDVGVVYKRALTKDVALIDRAYADGQLKGFYPAESFIEFGGGE